MNGSSQAMWTVWGIVEAPVERVARVLCAVHPGPADDHNGLLVTLEGPAEHGAIVLAGGPKRFVAAVTEPATSMDVEVDQEQHRVAVQGHLWYRGVYTVEPYERGSRLVYEVYNIAPTVMRALVPLWQSPFHRQMGWRLARVLRVLGDRLDCAAYLGAGAESDACLA